MALEEEQTADRTLTGGSCVRNGGRIGDYLCPINGMLGLCNTMLNNGAVLSCGPLVPPQVDQILKRGGCNDNSAPAAYACPAGMLALCQQYVKNKVVLSCQLGR